MKKRIFVFLAVSILLSACATSSAPQVTVTSEVTVTSTPLPTETPIPTPTLHPDFAALQEQIAASGGRFILHPDGMISDGAELIPGLTVAPDGTMTLTVDGEGVTLDPTKAVFDDENGFSYPGYEQNEDGNWVESVSEMELKVKADFEAHSFIYDVDRYDVDNEGVVTDLETKEVVAQYDENGVLRYDLGYVQKAIVEQGLVGGPSMPPKLTVDGELYGGMGLTPEIIAYAVQMVAQFRKEYQKTHGVDPIVDNKVGRMTPYPVDLEENKWVALAGHMEGARLANDNYLLYRPREDTSIVISVPIYYHTDNILDYVEMVKGW